MVYDYIYSGEGVDCGPVQRQCRDSSIVQEKPQKFTVNLSHSQRPAQPAQPKQQPQHGTMSIWRRTDTSSGCRSRWRNKTIPFRWFSAGYFIFLVHCQGTIKQTSTGTIEYYRPAVRRKRRRRQAGRQLDQWETSFVSSFHISTSSSSVVPRRLRPFGNNRNSSTAGWVRLGYWAGDASTIHRHLDGARQAILLQ